MNNGRWNITRLKADLVLLFVAAVWGSGFVAQRLASSHLNAFAFNGLRFMMAGLLLLPLIRFQFRFNLKTFAWALLAGLLLFGGSGFQQAGVKTTTAANAGFITGLYVVLVPLILTVFYRSRVPLLAWAAAVTAMIGTYLLSAGGAVRLSSGDWLVLAGSVLWAFHVIVVGYMAKRTDPLRFAVAQFLITGALNLMLGLAFGGIAVQNILTAGPAVLYSAVFPVAVGFTLQVFAQRNTSANDAALIFSTEAVFAALFGFLFLQEGLRPVQIFGCALILAAILIAQAQPVPQQEDFQPLESRTGDQATTLL